MALSRSIQRAVVDAAAKHNIEPAALLALVEVETSGAPFEADGRTPRFLMERHIIWREAHKKGGAALRRRFVRAGLAVPRWQGPGSKQYRDQGNSRSRLAAMARACAIDEEVAKRSASWGLGQTMGFLAEEIGFRDAIAMVEHQTGSIPGQLDCMLREVTRKGIDGALNQHDWHRAARLYNGAQYRRNRYHIKMADAHRRWERKLAGPQQDWPEDSLDAWQIKTIQRKLRTLGFHEVGKVDGSWGTRTAAGISAFQAHEGLTISGHYDADTAAALRDAAVPREPSRERAEVTSGELKEHGSRTIAAADGIKRIGLVGKVAGGGAVGVGAITQSGIVDTGLDTAQATVDKVQQAQSLWEQARDWVAPVADNPMLIVAGVVLVAIAVAVGYFASRIISSRVEDDHSGIHAGPMPEAYEDAFDQYGDDLGEA